MATKQKKNTAPKVAAVPLEGEAAAAVEMLNTLTPEQRATALAALGIAVQMDADEAEGEDSEDYEGIDDFGSVSVDPMNDLDAPEPRVGMRQRWVRMNILGATDAKNRAKRDRQGWRPRRAETVPEVERERFPTVADAKYGDVIQQGELVLCEIAEGLLDRRRKFYSDKAAGQLAAIVNQGIADTNKGADKHGFGAIQMQRKSTVRTGRRHILVADRP